MKTIKNTLRRVVTAAVLLLIAAVIAPVTGIQAQDVNQNADKVDQQRPQRRGMNTDMRQSRTTKTLDAMPDNASRFTLNSGREMYFLDGEFYTFAERESTFVIVPMNRLAARAPSGRGIAMRGQTGARQGKFARSNNGPRTRPVQRKAARLKAAKRHARWHRQHNCRFNHG